MFLQNHTKLINSFRHRKSINCFTSNLNNVNILALRFLKFRIKKKHKFLSNSRSVFKINFNRDFLYGTSLPFNWFKVSYTNRFMSVYKFSDNTIVSKPKPYGMDYSSVIHNYFITNFTDYFNNKSFNQKYLLMCKFNTKIFYLTKENSNRIYASAAGTYCTILNFDFFKKFVLIKLPSKKQLFLNYSYLAYTGRNSNIFYKYQYFNSFSKKFITKSKRPSVRGIAKNPVDHPNGGRSKVKKPFKTPWGLIAKKGK